MQLRHLSLSLVLSFAEAAASAQSPAGAPPQTPPAGVSAELKDEEATKVLEEIIKVQHDFAKTKKDLTASALERFKAGAATDVAAQDFYLAAYKVVNVDRRPAVSKDAQEANADWQKHAVDKLGEGPVSTVLRMQLQLLVMTMEAGAKKGESMDDATVKGLRTYMQAVAAFIPSASTEMDPVPEKKPVAVVGKKNKREDENRNGERASRDLLRKKSGLVKLLRHPVMNTVFTEAYNLGAYVDAPDKWPRSPADFGGAYEGVILPWYRANKKAELPLVWDEYLRAETAVEQILDSPDEFALWGTKEFKSLSWRKWLDLLSNGVTAPAAMQELSKIVRENPSHPDLKNWIADLARVSVALGGPQF